MTSRNVLIIYCTISCLSYFQTLPSLASISYKIGSFQNRYHCYCRSYLVLRNFYLMEPLTINRFLVEWKKLLTSVKYGGKMLIWERKNVVEIKHGGVTAEQFFYDERSCVMFAYLICHSLVLLFLLLFSTGHRLQT